MTRRQLGKLAAAGAAFQAKAASTYTGPLDTFEDKVKMPDFDPVLYTKRLYESAPLQLTFKAQNRKQAEAWQKKLHAKVVELLGGFPAERVPLQPKTLEVKEYPAYRREKLVFQTRPGMEMLAYLLLPKTAKTPAPAVICIPGHGRGVDDIVGIDLEGRDRTDKPPYEHDFAVQVAEAGMAAVAIEPLGFGARRDPLNKAKGLAQKGCEPVAGAALLLGQTILGWRVWDIMRTVDWIETRPELDAKRVGTMGISGGGTASLFSAALEPRVKAAMVSCYLNTFLDSIMSVAHCIDNYVPGILNWAEMYDVAGLIAPRPFISEAGQRDKIFPLAASVASFQRVKAVYDVFGAADLAEQATFDLPHEFSGAKGIPFMARHLSAGS
ncbi:MAG: alpha/beta hydrolase family protein [Acidobacteriota bacterium]|nr:alpha/beta hydrolase family protein [Acidobacteriota bacterium]